MRAALTALLITLSTQAFADIAECTVRQAVYINPGQVISDPEHEFIKKYFATKFMIFRSDTDVTLIKDGDNELRKYDFYKLLENSIESYWLEKNLSQKLNFASLSLNREFFKKGGVANFQWSGHNFRTTIILGCKTK